MAREIPEVVRAAAGLAATVLDEAQKLPETLPGLPVRALGLAMQVSMKLQQHYAGLVARGDELLTGLRGEDEPGLATFDDEEPSGAAAGVNTSAFDRVAETIIDVTDDDRAETDEVLDELAIEQLVDEAPAADTGTEDGAPGVDVLAPRGGVETVDATVTDEGVAAAEGVGAAPASATAEPLVENSLAAPAGPPVEGYDDWSIAQLRGRLRGYAAGTVQELLDHEQATRAREPYLRMLRNRLERLNSDGG
jgi:hypothetical protein